MSLLKAFLTALLSFAFCAVVVAAVIGFIFFLRTLPFWGAVVGVVFISLIGLTLIIYWTEN